jgi:hypothetical protein
LRKVEVWVRHYEQFWPERLTALREVLDQHPW